MAAADGIIIASPVYYGNVTTEVKALIDRAGTEGIKTMQVLGDNMAWLLKKLAR